MNKKKPVEPDEMRMSAAEFDEIMRGALGVPPLVRPDREDDSAEEGRERGQPKKPRQGLKGMQGGPGRRFGG